MHFARLGIKVPLIQGKHAGELHGDAVHLDDVFVTRFRSPLDSGCVFASGMAARRDMPPCPEEEKSFDLYWVQLCAAVPVGVGVIFGPEASFF